MSEIGQITVKIGADTYELQKGIAEAKTQLSGMERATDGVESALKAVASVALVAASAIAVITKNAIDSADNLGKMSQKIGVATEDLSKLAYAARLSDVDIGALQQSFVFLAGGLSEANQGTGSALQALNALGISFKNADGTLRPLNDVLLEVADRFATMEDGAAKTALATALFSRAGANMIPMLNQGSAGIREMGDELARFGGVVTGQYARSAEQFNDNLTRLATILQGISMETFGPLIAGLNASFEVIAKTDKALRGLTTTWGAFSLGGKEVANPTEALAKTEEAIIKVKKTIEALNQYPVLNKDDLFLANQQLTFLEAKSKALQNLFAQNQTPTGGTQQAPTMSDPKAAEEALKKEQDFKAAQATRLQTILEANMSEIELEKMKYAELLNQLKISKEMFAIEEETYQQWELDALNTHQQRLTDLTRKAANDRINEQARESQMVNAMRAQTVSLAVGLLQTLGQKSKAAALAAIVLNRGLMIAQTIQNTAAASMRAMAELGPIAGPPAVAAIQAMGATQVGLIAATGALEAGGALGGGGGGGASGVSNAVSSEQNTAYAADATARAGAPTGGATVNISLQGNTFNRDQVRDLITQINEVVSDGATLRLS